MISRSSPWDRDVARLAIPALGALVAEPLYLLTDTAIVGRLGTPQLGGLAVAQAVLLTAYALSIFLAYGTTGVVARRIGAGDLKGAAHQGVQGLWLAAALGTALAIAGLLLATRLVDLIGPEPPVRPFALTYLRISLLGMPGLLLILAGTGYLRGQQDTRTPLIVAVATALGNLVLELVLVFGLDLGVAGSAWSTVAATWAGAAVYLVATARSARRLGAGLAPDAAALRAYARIGFDLFVRTAALRASFLVAAVVAARLGTVPLAAHEISFQIWGLLALALDALAIAGQALIAHRLGAGDRIGARDVSRRLLEMGVVGGAALTVVVLALRPLLPGWFTNDPDVIGLAERALVVVALMQVLNAVVFVLDGVLIGAGDNRFLAGAMVLSAAVFIPPAIIVGVTGAGLVWLWLTIVVLLIVRAATMLWRWRSDVWLVVGEPA